MIREEEHFLRKIPIGPYGKLDMWISTLSPEGFTYRKSGSPRFVMFHDLFEHNPFIEKRASSQNEIVAIMQHSWGMEVPNETNDYLHPVFEARWGSPATYRHMRNFMLEVFPFRLEAVPNKIVGLHCKAIFNQEEQEPFKIVGMYRTHAELTNLAREQKISLGRMRAKSG